MGLAKCLLEVAVGLHAHHLRLLELLALDEVPAEGGRHLGHDGGGVPVAGVVARLGQVAHEPKDGDPEGERRQLVALRLQGQQRVLQRLPRVLVRVRPCKQNSHMITSMKT